ncbi:MAG: PilZ domain-containing protein [Proteobacteria bacterium]|nr:PilZ domain-containing protein [Pseudomonadota bacterium]
MSKASDKRKKARQPLQVVVEYERGKKVEFNFCSDFSESGIFIETSIPLETGKEIKLNIKLPPQTDIIGLNGIVRWRREANFEQKIVPGMGIEFRSLTDEQKNLITEHLEYYQRIIVNYSK